MPRPRTQPTPIVSKPHSLSNEASSIVCRIPQLLGRLHDLENEEAELDAKARQLVEQLPNTKDWPDKPSTPVRSIVFTPVSKPRSRTTVRRGALRTPPHIDPTNIETPVKAFLLMESFALATSVKGRHKGRVFVVGGSTELGERR